MQSHFHAQAHRFVFVFSIAQVVNEEFPLKKNFHQYLNFLIYILLNINSLHICHWKTQFLKIVNLKINKAEQTMHNMIPSVCMPFFGNGYGYCQFSMMSAVSQLLQQCAS